MSQSITHSKSEWPCISWQSRKCSSFSAISLIGFFDRRDFELIQMNMDSNYIAISADQLEDTIHPELHAEFDMGQVEQRC